MGVGGAGDCEREGVEEDSGGPLDQADCFGIVGFLDVCAVEDLLIECGKKRSFLVDFFFESGALVVVKNDLPAGVEAAGKASV